MLSGSVSVLRFVSIHAPTWGATRAKGFAEVVENCFNPRAHVGRDDRSQPPTITVIVSIHAPTWGATKRYFRSLTPEQSFNPRAHVGRDDKGSISETADTASFNPRAHVGRDI